MAFGSVINRPQFEVVFTLEELEYTIHAIYSRSRSWDEQDGLDHELGTKLYGQLEDLRQEVGTEF